MFYTYIRKKLELGKVKIGLTSLTTKDEKIFIEGKGIINFVKLFLSTKEKKQLKRIMEANVRNALKSPMATYSLNDTIKP